MQLNQAVSIRLTELLSEKNMTQYQLSTKSGLPRSTISNIINCTYPSMKLRIVHEVCQGLEIGINEFFSSPLFDEPRQFLLLSRSQSVDSHWCRNTGCSPESAPQPCILRAVTSLRESSLFHLWKRENRGFLCQKNL